MTEPSSAPAGQRWYVNSWAARPGQRVLARLVDSAAPAGLILLIALLGPHGRPLAQDCLIVAATAAFETISLTRQGSTMGMRVVGIRVSVIGRAAHPDWLTACRRSVPVALCYALWLPGLLVASIMPWALLLSIVLSPLHRGFHDRLSGTIVVLGDAPRLITHSGLATWWEPGADVVMSRWGRIPDLTERRRARAHRLDGVWWLVLVLFTATIASVGMTRVPLLLLWLAIVWVIVAIIDETWWVSQTGATPGHRSAGYRIVDRDTGQTPSQKRALLRALVVVPLLYIPPLQAILAIWVRVSASYRGPHDLAGNTVVVEPTFVPPRFVAPPPAPPPWQAWPTGPLPPPPGPTPPQLPPPPMSPIPGPF